MQNLSCLKFILLAFLPFLFSCGKGRRTASPERRDITQAVYASGKIFPLNDYKVYTKLPGYVQKIFVSVNDTVTVGQPLLLIRSEISEINVSTAKNALQLASENASSGSALTTALKADVQAAKSRFELDSINLEKYTNLYRQSATSALQLDQAKTAFTISRSNYLKAKSNLVSTQERLSTEYINAKNQYEAMLTNQQDYTISSVLNGKVYDVMPKEGELVSSQLPILEIGDVSRFEVELNVDEMDVSFLKEGQRVIYQIDAYKNAFLEGTIREIYPRISLGNKTSKVIADLVLPKNIIIYSGMSVEGNIIIRELKDALVIPREFVFDENKVKVKGKDEPVTIKTGIGDLEYIEVLSGIDESSELELR